MREIYKEDKDRKCHKPIQPARPDLAFISPALYPSDSSIPIKDSPWVIAHCHKSNLITKGRYVCMQCKGRDTVQFLHASHPQTPSSSGQHKHTTYLHAYAALFSCCPSPPSCRANAALNQDLTNSELLHPVVEVLMGHFGEPAFPFWYAAHGGASIDMKPGK
jgi:hypothetical protein